MNTPLTRRTLLQGAGATAAAIAFSGCRQKQGRVSSLPASALAVEPIVDPASLEKPNLTVGFVPVNDCAPFAVAWEKGFFRKYGLNVTLSREASWGNSRDGIIFGRLDASPVVSGAVTNARLGAEGARQFPLCAAMTIHRHGNALTMNRQLWEGGLRPWQTYNGNLEGFGRDLRTYWEKSPLADRVWAVVLSSSIYEYFVRYLLAATGIDPISQLRLIITPPPQMVSNTRIGSMQAYMVAEPWNTRAISGNEGVGFTFLQGREIWRGHPDRLLAMRESFIQDYPKTYRSLVKAMIEACQYCSNPANRAEVATLISQRTFTGAAPRYTQPGIMGNFN
jgi:nitrate/nitrite transport system substrate-binding protein